MRRWFALLALALPLVGTVASAQASNPVAPCALGQAQAALRGLDVQAQLFNTGSLFYGGTATAGDGYLVPFRPNAPSQNRSPVFSGSLWLAGRVDGQLRSTHARYANFKFRPGRTGPDGAPPSPAACTEADRIWVVSHDDVAQYLRTGVATDDLADWPVALGAPVLDGDGDPANYNLRGGDQPAIRGDVTGFWAMTDLAFFPADYRAVGVDVTVEAFAFRSPSPLLATTTVYRFVITNRNPGPVEEAYVGLFLDPDLGNGLDDYVGTDTTLAMVYAYNGDDEDEGAMGYGVPPAFGVAVIESPDDAAGQPLGLTAAVPPPSFTLCPTCRPAGIDEVGLVNTALRGRWGDGTPMRERGSGYDQPPTVPVTRHLFPGDPLAGQPWSEVNNGTDLPVNDPGYRRVVASTGPFRLESGEAAVVTYALVFAQGRDRFDSVRLVRLRAAAILALQESSAFEPSAVPGAAAPPTPYGIARPAPNPFTGATTLRLDGLAGVPVRVRVLDVLGREVQRADLVPSRDAEPVEIGAGLAPGTYLVRVSGDAFDTTVPVVKSR